MTCEKLQTILPDMLLDPEQSPTEAWAHIEQCSVCGTDFRELQNTMLVLDKWKVSEPSPYFATRLAVRLREEKDAGMGWLEHLKARLLYGSNLHLRPVAAGAFALLLVVGGGSYAGFVSLNRTMPPQHASATVQDLELLDTNAQTLQQMAAFEDRYTQPGAKPPVNFSD